MGAAIQGSIMTGDTKDVLLLDVTPLSLGIETLGGVCTKLIERNTTVPSKKSQTFSTAADNQPAVTIRVLQGERQMANDNTELGRFDLVGIPPAPRGIPQIEVTFDIDANGIVHVNAKDLGTGKEQSIRITASTKLSKEDIDKMIKEAEKFAEADKKRKEETEATNQADTLVYTVEKSLKDYGSKISAADKEAIEKKLKETKDAIASKDADKIKKAQEELAKASHKLAEEVYKDVQKKQKDGAKPQGKPDKAGEKNTKSDKKEDIVDADYKVEPDDKDKK